MHSCIAWVAALISCSFNKGFRKMNGVFDVWGKGSNRVLTLRQHVGRIDSNTMKLIRDGLLALAAQGVTRLLIGIGRHVENGALTGPLGTETMEVALYCVPSKVSVSSDVAVFKSEEDGHREFLKCD